MIDPISRSRSTPEQMRARIRAIEAELQGLSIDELMRGGREPRRQQSVSRGDAGRYDPNQPRVPAGNSDGGQWTDGESGGRAINDPRIVSDATPDNLWIPGADYAAVGHHIPPRAIWRHLPLQPETRRVLDEAVSGPLGIKLVNPVTGRTREHRWDREHQEYNQAVGELFKMYLDGLGAHGITPELMTPAHAREFVKAIHQSQDPRISNYLAMIRLLRSLRLLRGNE